MPSKIKLFQLCHLRCSLGYVTNSFSSHRKSNSMGSVPSVFARRVRAKLSLLPALFVSLCSHKLHSLEQQSPSQEHKEQPRKGNKDNPKRIGSEAKPPENTGTEAGRQQIPKWD